MGQFADTLRPFWLPGLHTVSGRQQKNLGGWVTDEQYQIYSPIGTQYATLHAYRMDGLLGAMAFDCSRMVTAAIESAEDIRPSAKLPRSLGWFVIRHYYSAFFAAHAILRIFGHSLTQLESPQCASVTKIAKLFGYDGGLAFASGYYSLSIDGPNEMVFIKKADVSKGTHSAVWRELHQLLGHLSSQVLMGSMPTSVAQQVSIKLDELQAAIGRTSVKGIGAWLSSIRNRTNYRHEFGIWFPYGDQASYCERLFALSDNWRLDPLSLQIWAQSDRDLQRFTEACILTVAIARDLCIDMAQRCPSGPSFHNFGCVSLLNRISPVAA